MQRLAARILRVDAGQILVAAPSQPSGQAPTKAVPKVGYMSFSTREAAVCAAVGMAHSYHRVSPESGEQCDGHFMDDLDWVYTCLAGTGLDLIYGEDRPITIDVALEELDDERMLPRRYAVPPLVLYAELQHVLSSNFDMTEWIQAIVKVVGAGTFSLPAALMMRSNIVRFRKMLHKKTKSNRDGSISGTGASKAWPLALHRVLVARDEEVDQILGTGLMRLGLDVSGPKELFSRGYEALLAHQGSGEEVGAASNDASSIMQDLVLRTMTKSSCPEATFRLRLRAHRTLRKLQISRTLDQLYAKFSQDSRSDTPGGSDDSSTHSDDDSDESEVSASEDEGSEAVKSQHSSVVSRRRQKWDKQQNSLSDITLTIQRVLGNARECVHVADIIFKALQVTKTIITTLTRFYSALDLPSLKAGPTFGDLQMNERHALKNTMKSPGTNDRIPPIWQIILDNGFIRMAIRAIYRHSKRPDVGACALSILNIMLDSGSEGHESSYDQETSEPSPTARCAIKDLSVPYRVLTLVNAAGKFSDGGHIEPLESCLKVLSKIVPAFSHDPLPELPQGREEEAAEALIDILHRHSTNEKIYLPTLHLLVGFRRSKKMSHSLYKAGLTTILREWLARSTAGEVQSAWRNAIGGDVMVGVNGRGLKVLREATGALMALRERIARCEVMTWDLLCSLSVEFASKAKAKGRRTACLGAFRGSRALVSKSATGFEGSNIDKQTVVKDSCATVLQALSEVCRQPRGTQWESAAKCLTVLVPCDLDAHGPLVLERGETIGSLMGELESGAAHIALPLLQAILNAEGSPPKADAVPGEIDSDQDEDDDDHGLPTSENDSEFPAANAEGGEGAEASRLAQNKIAKSLGMDRLLRALDSRSDAPELQARVLRVMGAVLVGASEGQEEMVAAFLRHNKSQVGDKLPGLGAGAVLRAIRGNISDASIVDPGLHVLRRTLDLDKTWAEKLGTLDDGIGCFIDVVWKHISGSKNARRRALTLLRSMHEANPKVVEQMVGIWEARNNAYDEMVNHRASLQAEAKALKAQKVAKAKEQRQPHKDRVPPAVDEGEGEEDRVPSAVDEGGGEEDRVPPAVDEGGGEEESVQPQAKMEGSQDHAPPEVDGGGEEEESDKPKVRTEGAEDLENESEAMVAVFESEHDDQEEEDLPRGLPEELLRFGAFIRVHRFFSTGGASPLSDVKDALLGHSEDPEVCLIGLRGLLKGQDEQLMGWLRQLVEEPEFVALVRRIVVRFPTQEMTLLVMRITTHMLSLQLGSQTEGTEEACAMASSGVMENTQVFNGDTWELLLEAMDALVGSRGSDSGRRIVSRLDLLSRLEEEWENILNKTDAVSKLIVKTFKEDTERILKR
eukprot:CAMPEP_0203849900 /NCGR_PEP_ID=MMETSP0359-20131031/6455_1 /ASSEMBLY_ACC=CAM_ASM_000338 /TAXON_ID=268821 /ORGANISM="Scrippsiella Hangoei, Strain SHTV-5" /LENGTH=1361 /DNA_ID=CAMNT_0050765719 /DNA_START=57 /DNA_END=4142 /DNA_ORIENTATION=+